MNHEPSPSHSMAAVLRAAAFLCVVLTALGAAFNAHAGLVTTEADDGSPGTLRAQIAAASPGDSITFAPALIGKSIVLTAGELVIDRDLTIAGPGATALAISGHGQRVFLINSGVTATFHGMTIRDGHTTEDGGGIFNQGTLTVSACTLSGNSARVRGGAISSTGTLTVEGCTLRGNANAPAGNFDYGGAIHNSGTLVIRNSVITGNSAFFGSGIATSGSALLVNTTLSANQGTSGPFRPNGALHNYGTATLAYCTVTDNQVNGILNAGQVHARNSILARNPWGNVRSDAAGSGFMTDGVNLSDDDSFPGATVVATAQLALAPLANYGGTVMTMALLPGSVAIDAASDCLDLSGNPLLEDSRGYPRPFGGTCDVGAYEAQAPSDLPVTSLDAYSVDEDGSLQVPAPGLLANDQHHGGASLAITAASVPAHGTVAVNADGSFTYRPAPDYYGSDTFTYYVTDGLNGPAVGSVNLTVHPVNDPPTIAAQSLRTLRDVPIAITMTASDVEGDPFTFGLVDPPSHGVLSGTLPNLTYTPNPDYTGRDRFTCRATDSLGAFSTMDISIEVQPYTIWTGLKTTVNVSNGYWGFEAPTSDPLTSGVVIAADLDYGLPYNSVLEQQSDIFVGPFPARSPADTEWALGTTADVASLRFQSFDNLFFKADGDLAGKNLVMHLVSDGILVDLKFTYYAFDFFFTYERSTPLVRMALNGSSRMSIPCCQPFVDPGATAFDLAGNPLEVSVTGPVDVTTGGSYVLIYTATDSQGNIGTLRRTVDVGAIEVTVYSGFTRAGGGAPFSSPVGSFSTSSVQFAPFGDDSWHPFGLDTFGAEVRGALTVEAAGPYTFSLESDDGSLLFIDGQLVIDNGGDHGPLLRTGTVQLAPGRHCFEIQFYNSGGLSGLNLSLPTGVAYACPALNCPKEIRRTSEAGSCGAVVHFDLPTLADPCLDLTVTCTPSPGSFFPIGTTPVTCEAARADGTVVGRCSFNLTVVDATPPTLNCPDDITVVTSSSQGMPVNYPPATATDLCSTPGISYSRDSGARFPVGTTPVTVTAADLAGNTASCPFQVRVVYGWSGFQIPIAPDGSSVLKLGTTVSVKFQLIGASAGIQDAVAWFSYAKRDTSSGGAGLPTRAGSFRYDAKKDQYLFNWNTKGLSAGFYDLDIDLGDGVPRKVSVELKPVKG